ncbi:hypothetical protein GN956_G26375 [Arapaima gigas]
MFGCEDSCSPAAGRTRTQAQAAPVPPPIPRFRRLLFWAEASRRACCCRHHRAAEEGRVILSRAAQTFGQQGTFKKSSCAVSLKHTLVH